MRALLGLLALVLTVGTATPAVAAEPVATTTTLTASVVGHTVTLTATVSAADGSIPEGVVTFDADTVFPLVEGTTTWSWEVESCYCSWVATYVPADERWSGSVSTTTTAGVGDRCTWFVDGCGMPYAIDVSGLEARRGGRARLRVTLSGRGNLRQPGTVVLTLTGRRGFAWTRAVRVERDSATVRTPRLRRAGTYRLRADARLDAGLERSDTFAVRVVRRPAVGSGR